MIKKAISRNRIRKSRLKRLQTVQRSIRLKIFDYEDRGLRPKAERVLATCARLLKPFVERIQQQRKEARHQIVGMPTR